MRWTAMAAALFLGGCVSLPAARTVACGESKRPEIRLSEDGRTASIELDVLTYNVEGLPRFVRKGRRDPLGEIGDDLARLRAAGQAPDVVMLQEVFSRRARASALTAGYPSLAPGPSARRSPEGPRGPKLPGRRNPRKGEIGLKFSSSGVLIAAEYPLTVMKALPFARCAGIDCLSNKGVAFARMAIPGVPAPVDLYTTHMNSTGASRVPERRHLAAHREQAREIAEFVDETSPPGIPVIFGGDSNMRNQRDRFGHFVLLQDFELVHTRCLAEPASCDVRMSWDGDEPWMDTQDLQLFQSGTAVKVRPIRVEAMFDGSEGSPRHSDHDAFRVVYELSWDAADTAPGTCAAEPLAKKGPSFHMRGGSRADAAFANPVRSGRKQP